VANFDTDNAAVSHTKATATPVGNLPTHIITVTSGAGGVTAQTFLMRAHDGTLARDVYWKATAIDSTGSAYTGPGPLTNIRLIA